MSTKKQATPAPDAIRKDAKGQFKQSDKGSHNSGVSSAKPRVITGHDDATSQKPSGEDWKIHRDEGEANEGEFHG
ncbi:hypothetical protein DFR52_101127 [Hoeflea marina]|uniref:Uncharacterized protein n=1 Tax=Hoeflea marina TaxID=274592 RepID=A0A317PR89_9HYPH|nr:hypothetical protein [Hoeflea marina]PWW03447.1 hypothetical protein DFR52_101127 [Hoeflea marina]